MRVETREVRPDVVITLSYEEAQQLKRVVGLGTVDYVRAGIPVAEATIALRHDLYDALRLKGV